MRNERQIYVFITISDNLAVISVAHSCIPLVASELRPCGFLTSSCNFFASYLLYMLEVITIFALWNYGENLIGRHAMSYHCNTRFSFFSEKITIFAAKKQ